MNRDTYRENWKKIVLPFMVIDIYCYVCHLLPLEMIDCEFFANMKGQQRLKVPSISEKMQLSL